MEVNDELGKKRCNRCGELKTLSDFYRQADMRDGYRNNCKSCHLAQHQAWYALNRAYEIDRVGRWQRENPDRVNAVQRRHRSRRGEEYKRLEREGHLRRKYGLTQNLFEALVAAQLGNCAICGANKDLDLHVDHDHRSRKVRGLLCGKCNKAIGLLSDKPNLLRSAAEYLERAERFYARSPD